MIITSTITYIIPIGTMYKHQQQQLYIIHKPTERRFLMKLYFSRKIFKNLFEDEINDKKTFQQVLF